MQQRRCLAWNLIILEGQTPEEQIEMLLCAIASRYLWAQAGGDGGWIVARNR